MTSGRILVIDGNVAQVRALQAVSFSCAGGMFCGMQYHSEHDYLDIAEAAKRYAGALLRLLEIRNWLDGVVLPRARRHG